MRVAGMICEYNPLHLGHTYLMEQTRELLGADTALVCCMSGNFVQRGDFAVMNKHARAEAALRCGADLVLELPLPWATASAETFARGGVELLCDTGVVTHLAFGSECGSIERLSCVRDTLLTPNFQNLLQEKLSEGVSYPVARKWAAEQKMGPAAGLLDEPNNILGIEYLKALRMENSDIVPMTVSRYGTGHDAPEASVTASSSCLREMLRGGTVDGPFMPQAAREILRREIQAGRAPVFSLNCQRAILARLRTMSEEDFAPFDTGGEGLYHRFYQMSRRAVSLEALLADVKTKRYPYAALRRMLLRIYLQADGQEIPSRPPYLRLLGANARGRELLREMKEKAKRPLLTKAADVRLLNDEARRVFDCEVCATDLYTLAYPDLRQSAGGSEWTTNPMIIEE